MNLHKNVLWLKKRYVEQENSIATMALEANVSERTIRRALKKAGLIK